MTNLTALIYTHSSCKEVHTPFFGRLKKYFPELGKIHVLCDVEVPGIVTSVYTDDNPHYMHMLDGLSAIEEDYVLYLQEDYILHSRVDVAAIERYLNILQQDFEVNYIRLLTSGVGECTPEYNFELLQVDKMSEYYYSTQATIWRRNVLLDLFKTAKLPKLSDESKNSEYLRTIPGVGLFPKERGRQIGGHYDSKQFPYIATAKVKKQWNIVEYPFELSQVFREYNIQL